MFSYLIDTTKRTAALAPCNINSKNFDLKLYDHIKWNYLYTKIN